MKIFKRNKKDNFVETMVKITKENKKSNKR